MPQSTKGEERLTDAIGTGPIRFARSRRPLFPLFIRMHPFVRRRGMKFASARPYADPEAAARLLLS